jgi:hypothetical protein
MLPSNWGLKGKMLERAKACYELEGEELDYKLLDIDYNPVTSDYKKIKLELDLKYNKITKEQYDYAMVEINNIKDTYNYHLEMLNLNKQYKKLSDVQYDKELATLNKEPWVYWVGHSKQGSSGFNVDLDWNEYHVEDLKKAGYTGVDDESIVHLWFGEVCREVAMEEDNTPLSYSGKDFGVDPNGHLDAGDIEKNFQTKISKNTRDDGAQEYS